MRIRKEILKGGRAGYGEQIVATLSRQLAQEYDNGFNSKNLHRGVFSETGHVCIYSIDAARIKTITPINAGLIGLAHKFH